MAWMKYAVTLVATLCLSGCFLSTKTPFISEADAVFPFTLTPNEKISLIHCGRDDKDLSDWSDCKPLQIEQSDHHYVVTDPEDHKEGYAIRFAKFRRAAALSSNGDYIFQVSSVHDTEDEHIYGFARIANGKLFLALADAQFIRESTCLAIGAEYPAEEKSCTGAISSFFELQTALKDISEAANYTMYIKLPKA